MRGMMTHYTTIESLFFSFEFCISYLFHECNEWGNLIIST